MSTVEVGQRFICTEGPYEGCKVIPVRTGGMQGVQVVSFVYDDGDSWKHGMCQEKTFLRCHRPYDEATDGAW